MKRLAVIFLALVLSACVPTAPYLPASAKVHRLVENPYARFMWSLHYPDAVLIGAPNLIIADGGVQTGTTAFDTMSTNTTWTLGADFSDSFVRGTTLYRTFYDGLEAYDTQSGRRLWETRLPETGNSHGLYVNSANIFLSDQQGSFLMLDRNGRLLTAPHVPSGAQALSLENDRLYYWDSEGLHARDEKTQEVIWNANVQHIRSAQVTDTAIYLLAEPFADSDTIYVIDKAGGKILWKWNQHVEVISNLCLLGPDLFFLTAEGALVVIRTSDGHQVTRIAFTGLPLILNGPDQQVDSYQVAGDPVNGVVAVAFGDTHQILAFEMAAAPEVLMERPLQR